MLWPTMSAVNVPCGLWFNSGGGTQEIQDWLVATLHLADRAEKVRSEIVTQLCALCGPTEAVRAELDKALVTTGDVHLFRNTVCRLIARHWGQEAMFQTLLSHQELRRLERLYLFEIAELTQCPSGEDFPELEHLTLAGCPGLGGPEALRALTGMNKLQVLWLNGCAGLTQAPSGADCRSLVYLSMEGCTGLKGPDSLRPLAGMTKLVSLYIEGCTGLEGVDVPALMKELGLTCSVYGPGPQDALIDLQGGPLGGSVGLPCGSDGGTMEVGGGYLGTGRWLSWGSDVAPLET